jgi:hypothetical protein
VSEKEQIEEQQWEELRRVEADQRARREELKRVRRAGEQG